MRKRSHKELIEAVRENTRKRQELDAEKDELIRICQIKLEDLKRYTEKKDKLSW